MPLNALIFALLGAIFIAVGNVITQADNRAERWSFIGPIIQGASVLLIIVAIAISFAK